MLLPLLTQAQRWKESPSPLREVYGWSELDIFFPDPSLREAAILSGNYIPANNLPLGIEVWGDRIFIALPKWKDGIPVTLASVPRNPNDAGGLRSPPLLPYPSWEWHLPDDCSGMTSVFRMAVDPCGRLWVLDSGTTDVITDLKQRCPQQLLIFDLKTDTLLRRYILPQDQVKEGSLFTNIVVDVRDGRCDEAFAYIADVWRFGLVVYNLRENRSWRITHNLFLPDPLRCTYNLLGLNWTWMDGIFGMSLTPVDRSGDRILFFHPMSSFREFAVSTEVIRTQNASEANPEAFVLLKEPRGYRNMQSATAGVDRNGVMFYSLVAQNAIGCWNTRHQYGYRTQLQGIVAMDNTTLIFPNDLKIDQDGRQNVWVISNRLPFFLYRSLDPNDINFRIFSAPTKELVRGTVCDPELLFVPSGSPLQCEL
ncbi:dopaminechrome tautomerase [Anabrus simplex]|uniref:dopaminechrome tautomerase n=1 Tax=Anabrus simplex TaxID=316456 RepID=UPI0035A3461C